MNYKINLLINIKLYFLNLTNNIRKFVGEAGSFYLFLTLCLRGSGNLFNKNVLHEKDMLSILVFSIFYNI